MNPIHGIDAIRKAQEISKVEDGTFTIAFHSYNRTKQEAGDKMCYRILIRFTGFPEDGYKLRNVQWLNE
ncbi:MAG: hypothetical protein D4R64_01820 [Porphyromonadaceae bacterium]|nr:MAG: hypothetical protein D4R64_01820 [Porphyromonadaceae bacterium]